ncbi:glycosyltransferase [Gordonia amicalis]|uniref:glycosyltransferase n=1 Tax=Gordonia amicalis TaxID=89053 RepID=UPI0002A6552A|nr:glycosyltransferase [Gordonia amicalis]NKX77506.1 glycosyltransferase family 4 protein [Gordonia amicalis]GAC52379.1 putative glycosyltransferase [Gordonia amicalis NBRC 100051 = JCM 11271]
MIVSWVRTHGRSKAIAEQLDIPAVFLSEATARKPAPSKYLYAAIDTVREVRRNRPRFIILMLPPFPLLLLVRVLFPRTPVIGDLHTGVFLNPKWRPFLRPTLFLLRGGTCVVTNHPLQARCNRAGLEAIVLHDPLPNSIPEIDRETLSDGRQVVLCPLGYANDEPIEELLRAAEDLAADGVQFRLTGRAPGSVKNAAPPNVKFTGYLTNSDYDAELANCDVVMALTTRDHTMQRAGYEAIAAAKPQVTADFKVLRDFHADAAIYVDPHSHADIARGVREALSNSGAITARVRRRFEQVLADQSLAVEELRRAVKSAEGKSNRATGGISRLPWGAS